MKRSREEHIKKITINKTILFNQFLQFNYKNILFDFHLQILAGVYFVCLHVFVCLSGR